MSLLEKNCLITGANSGLGFAVALKLAQRGAHCVMVCRTSEKGAAAARAIEKEVPRASVYPMECDLASMSSVRSFIEAVKDKYTKLDLLFNNAALMKQKRTVTDDGFEMMFQVNYLAPFILMTSFLELLREGSSPEIINNGRPEDDLRIDFDDLQFSSNYHMYNSFFQTKLYLLLADLELSSRETSKGITVTMADPGPFKSNLVREVSWFGWFKNLVSANVATAAENMLHVLELPEEEKSTGRVFEKRDIKTLVPYWQDAGVRQRLWETTEALLNTVPET